MDEISNHSHKDHEDYILNKIKQYQHSIIKHVKSGNEEKILGYIKKLYDMPVTLDHLRETGIGRTINSLRKYSGDVGPASKAIVFKWKTMVAREEEAQNEDEEIAIQNSVETEKITEEQSPIEKDMMDTLDSSQIIVDGKIKYRNRDEKNHSLKNSKHRESNKRKSEENRSSKKKKLDDCSSYNDKSHKTNSHSTHSTKLNNEKSSRNDVPNNHKEDSSSHHHHRSSNDKKESKSKSKKSKTEKTKSFNGLDGIDSESGASFAEALGMVTQTSSSKNKKKSHTSTSTVPSTSTSTSSSSKQSKQSLTQSVKQSAVTTSHVNIAETKHSQTSSKNLLSADVKLAPLDASIISDIPSNITTNYKPLSQYSYNPHASASSTYKPMMTEEEALSVVISSKTQRTKVYSGNKTNWGYVPSLFQFCVRVLQENIDGLEYTGGVPYEILKPVLERATVSQLLNIEYHNPYLVEDTDELWEKHCKREHRGAARQEMESWRDMYLRCKDERDAKLRKLTVNIKQSIDKSLPVRQTKLAYVDNHAMPPRSIARKQAKYGTADGDRKPLITPSSRLNAIASNPSGTPKVSVPNPGSRASSSSGAVKAKKAPLMMKTLALMKGRFGRR